MGVGVGGWVRVPVATSLTNNEPATLSGVVKTCFRVELCLGLNLGGHSRTSLSRTALAHLLPSNVNHNALARSRCRSPPPHQV